MKYLLDTHSKITFFHKDPFDRLIIAHSLAENLPIITKDTEFANYPVASMW
jgi:PIN domain nuclease of toxin-antitoxin system